GVVLDQLNDFLKPHGFCFGPDVATSARATLGGMIANNSSGARVPVYGTTADHVISLEIVMADGRIEKIGRAHDTLGAERKQIDNLVRAKGAEMAERWPPGLLKRWPGYGIERFLRAPNNLADILAGSEGTLAAIFSAELKISPLRTKKLGLRTKILTDPAQMNSVWSVRKSGLSLLTGCIGPAKPVAFIEDAAVRPAQLPAYVRGLQSIMKPLGLEASYYGHAASGLLHVRPVLDLHSASDLKKFRQVADQTSALVRQFKGS